MLLNIVPEECLYAIISYLTATNALSFGLTTKYMMKLVMGSRFSIIDIANSLAGYSVYRRIVSPVDHLYISEFTRLKFSAGTTICYSRILQKNVVDCHGNNILTMMNLILTKGRISIRLCTSTYSANSHDVSNRDQRYVIKRMRRGGHGRLRLIDIKDHCLMNGVEIRRYSSTIPIKGISREMIFRLFMRGNDIIESLEMLVCSVSQN